jgi:hypothetical protein
MSGFVSIDTSSSPSNKQLCFVHSDKAQGSQAGNAKNLLEIKSPAEAALAMKNLHIEMLHEALQPFLHDLTETGLRCFASYYYKNAKHKEIHLKPNYVPVSCKKIGLTLQGIDEVKEAEDYKSLCSHLAVRLEEIQRNFAKDYAITVKDMNHRALWHQFLASFCKLLPKVAKVFIPQYGIKGYTKHQAVVDLVATLSDKALASIKTTACKFLIIYKKTNAIAVIPMPTVQHNLQTELNKINGPPPLGAMAQPSQPTAVANAMVTTTAATIAMPMAQAGANASMITPFGF